MARRRSQKATVELEAKDGTSRPIQNVESRFKRLTNSLRQNALKITGALAGLALAFRGLEKAADLQGTTEALRRNLAKQGQDLDTFLGKLRQATDAQISNAALIESSARALALGIPAEEIASLAEIARASAIQLGTSVTQAFDDITTGIGRASPLILDNLGLTINLTEAYTAAAEEIGKTTEELTQQEKSQALLNAVLKQGKERVDAYGDAQSELGRRLGQTRALLSDFTDGIGQASSVLALGLGAVVTRASAGFVFLARGIALVVGELARLAPFLPFVGDQFERIADGARVLPDGRVIFP